MSEYTEPYNRRSRRGILRASAFGIASLAELGGDPFNNSENGRCTDSGSEEAHPMQTGENTVLLSCPLMSSDLIHENKQN